MTAYQPIQTPSISWLPSTNPQQSLLTQSTGATTHPASYGLSRELGKQPIHAAELGILNEVRRYFVLPSDSSVLSFLSEHRGITSILMDAVPRLKEYFGATTIFKLKAPIDESGVRTLYAVVIGPGDVKDVRNFLERFEDDWWLDRSRMASGHLTFTYELV